MASPPNTKLRLGLQHTIAQKFRLITDSTFGHSRLAANLVGDYERTGDSNVGYALGYRYEFSEKAACGVEAQGPFTSANKHELLAAVYGEPIEQITLKAGAGPEVNRSGVGLITRFGMVWHF